ncbi:MAG: diguanylate cyclase [Gemmatimonadetes bacterium]|jgi:diguanylate cyclase (GGDEF)-like protein/PAS domain S-box-containing protein|nr:diguanylate cyclase [Gemmatimonadota bacterium]
MHPRTTHFQIALVTLLAAGPAGAAAHAQRAPITIAEAMTHEGRGDTVTITGRASVGTGKMQSRVLDIAIQDATGGLRVFSRTIPTAVQAGDSVVATGQLKRYRGDLELVVSRLAVVGTTRRAVGPYSLPIDHRLIASHPGQLVRIHGRVTRTGFSEGGQWLRLRGTTAGRTDSLTLWVPANHGASVSFQGIRAADSIVATGIVSAYQDNAEDPVVWQIVPRDTADIVIADSDRPLPSWLGWSALAGLLTLAAAILVGRLTARRQLGALRETQARYRQLLALSPDAVIVHARGQIRFANPAAAQMLGVPGDDALVGRPLEDYVHPESREALHAAASDVSPGSDDAATRFRARLLDAKGGVADVEVTSSPCVYHDQPALVLLARDITAQLRYERDLHALALVDELTGLQNRRGFSLFAEQERARARRNGRSPVLVFADLDGLKQINDRYGHAAGDDALRIVARALRTVLRESDIVARWSGDEFVALMGEGGETAAESIAQRLNAAIASLRPESQPFDVTASIGMSTLEPELPLASAMERADAELYATKKRERRSGATAALSMVDDGPGTR